MNVLIVDDDQIDREQIIRSLIKTKKDYTFVEADSVDKGLTIFKQQKFDIILLDYRMPQRDGIELLLELKATPSPHSLAIIVLSNSDETDIALDCIKAGAQDFLLKQEITAARLNRAILQAQTRFDLEEKLYQSYKDAKNIAEHDSLTGLANRYAFEEKLKSSINQSTTRHEGTALILFDIDNFKLVNDTHGHDVGDILLKKVSKKITTCLRGNEALARIGGDEFAIILQSQNKIYSIARVARRILRSLGEPFNIQGLSIKTSISIGISISVENSISPEELLKYADIAMYRAKKLGKNQVCYFEDEMQKQFLYRYKVEHELLDAIVKNQFTLHFQPVMSTNDNNSLIGFEALIRWQIDGKLHMPDNFIEIAEDSGAILKIGEWVIENAIYQLSFWQQTNKQLTMAINLSAVQLSDVNLIKTIKSALTKHNVSPNSVEFEITETAFLEGSDTVINMLNTLRVMGCGIALDDFGTGFSSVSHLQNFPISTVKIDKSLLLLSTDKKTRSLIKGLSLMLHSLELNIVAEGIETEDALVLCRELKIHKLQGYLLSRPLNIDNINDKYFN
ncbi:two-component system response regulator [Colwellia echini]|uniref:EAL domain-containing protein n=1 Tax=Colwellia echini TaxID=1982103 RepID=A0ABY3N0L6_9GAMM|nr:GGDEF domain-containing response regulator [Colwellia echini]TYK67033.1 EAL domain-containing protein [Colwellia echini]